MAAVRLRILDEYGNLASYAQLPLRFETAGEIALAGPDSAAAEGGMCGTYIRTLGREGAGSLRISAPGLESVALKFEVHTEV